MSQENVALEVGSIVFGEASGKLADFGGGSSLGNLGNLPGQLSVPVPPGALSELQAQLTLSKTEQKVIGEALSVAQKDITKLKEEREQIVAVLVQAYRDLHYVAKLHGDAYSPRAVRERSQEMTKLGIPHPEAKFD